MMMDSNPNQDMPRTDTIKIIKIKEEITEEAVMAEEEAVITITEEVVIEIIEEVAIEIIEAEMIIEITEIIGTIGIIEVTEITEIINKIGDKEGINAGIMFIKDQVNLLIYIFNMNS